MDVKGTTDKGKGKCSKTFGILQDLSIAGSGTLIDGYKFSTFGTKGFPQESRMKKYQLGQAIS